MTMYRNVKVNISEGQKEKLQHAIKTGCSAVSIRLGHEDLEGEDILVVTNSQPRKVAKALESDRGIKIRMSSKKLKHNTKTEGGFLGLFAGALLFVARVGRRCSFRVSLIWSTKNDGIRSLSQERRMR